MLRLTLGSQAHEAPDYIAPALGETMLRFLLRSFGSFADATKVRLH